MADTQITAARPRPVPPSRPEYLRDVVASGDIGVVQKPLTLWQRLANQAWLRKVFILVVIAAGWQLYARELNNPLLVPTFTATLDAFWAAMISGDLPQKVANSVLLLLKGYAIGLALAMLFTALAMMSRIGNDLLETLTSAFNPLPAIALLPLALIWFGLGEISIIFVLVHSVLWAVALNTHSGFRSVSNTLRMVGRNYGLRGPRYHREDPDPGGVPLDPHRTEDRLGLRLAHPDRGGTGVRRLVRQGRARLVHLREQEHARHSGRVRRPVDGDPDRTDRGELDLPQYRGCDRASMGHAVLGPPGVGAETSDMRRRDLRNHVRVLEEAPDVDHRLAGKIEVAVGRVRRAQDQEIAARDHVVEGQAGPGRW